MSTVVFFLLCLIVWVVVNAVTLLLWDIFKD